MNKFQLGKKELSSILAFLDLSYQWQSSFILLVFNAAWRQKVFIKLSGVKKMRGDINLVFHDTEGNTKEYEIAR